MDDKWKEALKKQLGKLAPGKAAQSFVLALGADDPVLVIRPAEIPLASWATVAATELRLELPSTKVVIVGDVVLDDGVAQFTTTQKQIKGSIQLTTVNTTLRKLGTALSVSSLSRAVVTLAAPGPDPVDFTPLVHELAGGDQERFLTLAEAFGGPAKLAAAVGVRDTEVYRPLLDTLCEGKPGRFRELVDTFGQTRLRKLAAVWQGVS